MEDPVLLSKSQEQGIRLVTVQQSLQAKDVNIRRLIQSFLAVDTKFVEIVMSLIILTSGNKIMINESELRLFMSFKGLFVWLTKTQNSIYLHLLILVGERINKR